MEMIINTSHTRVPTVQQWIWGWGGGGGGLVAVGPGIGVGCGSGVPLPVQLEGMVECCKLHIEVLQLYHYEVTTV